MQCRTCKGSGRVSLDGGTRSSICPSCAGAGGIRNPQQQFEHQERVASVDWDYRREQVKQMVRLSIDQGADADAAVKMCRDMGYNSEQTSTILQELVDEKRDGEGATAIVTAEPEDKLPELPPGVFPAEVSAIDPDDDSQNGSEDFLIDRVFDEPMAESGAQPPPPDLESMPRSPHVERYMARPRNVVPVHLAKDSPAEPALYAPTMRKMSERAQQATSDLEEALARGDVDADMVDKHLVVVLADTLRTYRTGTRVQAANALRAAIAEINRRKAKSNAPKPSMRDAVSGNGNGQAPPG